MFLYFDYFGQQLTDSNWPMGAKSWENRSQ